MALIESRLHSRETGDAPPAADIAGLDARLDAVPLSDVVERYPVVRLASGREPAVAAERLLVSWRALAAALGIVAQGEVDLLRHAVDRMAERIFGGAVEPSLLDHLPARVPVLLPLPLRPIAVPAPRPGLVGVLPLAAAAAPGGVPLAARRAELAALGWRLGIDELDAAALRFVAPAALEADLLVLRWSPALAREQDALCGTDPQSMVLAGCDGPDALEWGRSVGLALFSGSGAEGMLPMPGRTMPGRAAARRAMPSRAMPGPTRPVQAPPEQTSPKQTPPERTSPGQALPGQTSPGWTASGRAAR